MSERTPIIGPDVDYQHATYIHPTACLYGNIKLAEGVNIWANVVIRSEMGETTIGKMTNIQDFVMIHGGGVKIGANCSITHHCTIHLADNCLIGINSTIMDGAVIGDNCTVAGGSFVTENTIIPPNSIVMGAPAKARRQQNNYVANKLNAWMYYHNGLAYSRGDHRIWDSKEFQAESQAMRATLEAEYTSLFGED
jgi:carbonic anhydrase/acetyltransferase-like protein (isoleucine patch superfamily)